ncbi:uncharacterized protein EV422DRAFT_369401 [Fimicolochytrium jonesii]|uniref:uncharacterized protein n=1 Tax=Fimicolochytrium jonesii TaxID=1396493 RepID=UPI0022FDEF72|nr:uncharacterized protein EV422DRAFT_369401 [Fimicolochytrium jonesii]KAI8823772.1 hypothetical protein EV422DRAFT_369401 [Fimicolochytrium jonesii]
MPEQQSSSTSAPGPPSAAPAPPASALQQKQPPKRKLSQALSASALAARSIANKQSQATKKRKQTDPPPLAAATPNEKNAQVTVPAPAADTARAGFRPSKLTISPSPFAYLRLRFTSSDPTYTVTPLHFRNAINHALREVFRIVGAAHHVDLLRYSESKRVGIIRTTYESVPTVRAALTLLSEYQGTEYRVDVLDCSPCLFSLAHSSQGGGRVDAVG